MKHLGEEFVERISPGAKHTIEMNDKINENCPAWKMFVAGKEQVGFSDFKESGLFVFHGTPNRNIPPIFENGFNPIKRGVNGQVHGPGEYFLQYPKVSKGYCSGGGEKLIVCYILTNISDKLKNVRDGLVYVINNPIGESLSYCLPLFVVTIPQQFNTLIYKNGIDWHFEHFQINTGQGDSALLLLKRRDVIVKSILIDCGTGKYSPNLYTTLENEGVKHLDAIIITHWHGDHIGCSTKDKSPKYFENTHIFCPSQEIEFIQKILKGTTHIGVDGILKIGEQECQRSFFEFFTKTRKTKHGNIPIDFDILFLCVDRHAPEIENFDKIGDPNPSSIGLLVKNKGTYFLTCGDLDCRLSLPILDYLYCSFYIISSGPSNGYSHPGYEVMNHLINKKRHIFCTNDPLECNKKIESDSVIGNSNYVHSLVDGCCIKTTLLNNRKCIVFCNGVEYKFPEEYYKEHFQLLKKSFDKTKENETENIKNFIVNEADDTIIDIKNNVIDGVESYIQNTLKTNTIPDVYEDIKYNVEDKINSHVDGEVEEKLYEAISEIKNINGCVSDGDKDEIIDKIKESIEVDAIVNSASSYLNEKEVEERVDESFFSSITNEIDNCVEDSDITNFIEEVLDDYEYNDKAIRNSIKLDFKKQVQGKKDCILKQFLEKHEKEIIKKFYEDVISVDDTFNEISEIAKKQSNEIIKNDILKKEVEEHFKDESDVDVSEITFEVKQKCWKYEIDDAIEKKIDETEEEIEEVIEINEVS
ncbi:hypothetical protein QTN25_004202 [Entamoeba marina]